MSTRHALEQLRAELDRSGQAASADQLRRYLRLVRELKLRDPENVAQYGSQLLRTHKAQLREDELWLVMEQVAMAAMDCKATDLANSLVFAIRSHFPNSLRGERLMSMFAEFKAMGQAAQLEEVQGANERVLKEHPQNELFRKREVAMQKSLGNLPKAIDLLKKYVELFTTDNEAWEELADLYLQAQMYLQAAHCYEELLMHRPASIAVYVQYADVLYTMGGATGANYRLALSYYAAAVKLSKGENTRALYGVCACQAQLNGIGKVSGRGASSAGTEDHSDLASLAAATLVQRYQAQAPDMLPLVEALLTSEQLDASV
ncbi:hypothetical protein WJX72_010425 [[Myrmecia] bisecta]|uniref:ER membrane protein complex subunit 2 n=1 Tax=[Myrmecia] bisecta TaxID=41462 RepID=A0AAW1RA34_9CHLO